MSRVELHQVLGDRWSCRAFESTPVDRAELEAVFELAQRTPSWCNTQPWQVTLVSGDLRDQLSKAFIDSVLSGAGGSDFPLPTDYVGVYQERRRESGFALYQALDIARDDKLARGAQMLKNFVFFGAPHVAIITSDATQGVYGAVDCGGYVANLVNAAQARGLATCPQAAIAMQSPVVHEVLGIPAERLVVCGVAIGYADLDHPANGFRTSRATLDDAVTFVS